MLRNSIQHQLYYEQRGKDELTKLIKFLKLPVYIILIFNVIEALRQAFFPSYVFGLSFMFWGICMMFIFYWIPNKKEYAEWVKNHSTF